MSHSAHNASDDVMGNAALGLLKKLVRSVIFFFLIEFKGLNACDFVFKVYFFFFFVFLLSLILLFCIAKIYPKLKLCDVCRGCEDIYYYE